MFLMKSPTWHAKSRLRHDDAFSFFEKYCIFVTLHSGAKILHLLGQNKQFPSFLVLQFHSTAITGEWKYSKENSSGNTLD